MGPENNVGLGGCWIKECLLPYLCMVTVPHIMVELERMLDYRGVGLARFHCIPYNYNIRGLRFPSQLTELYIRIFLINVFVSRSTDHQELSEGLDHQHV